MSRRVSRRSWEQEAELLVQLKGAYYVAAKEAGDAARSGVLSAALVDRVLAAGAAVDAACEAFRRAHFPRRYRIVCAQGQVFSVSRTGRSQLLYPHDEAAVTR